MDTSTASSTDTTALVAPVEHTPPAHGCKPLNDEPAGSEGGGGSDGGGGCGGGSEGGDGGGGDAGVGATLSSPSTSSSD